MGVKWILRRFYKKSASPTKVGGQAVLEGIMMKGEDRTAVVIRKPDGKLHIKTELLKKAGKIKSSDCERGFHFC